jgi:hypothetical protein
MLNDHPAFPVGGELLVKTGARTHEFLSLNSSSQDASVGRNVETKRPVRKETKVSGTNFGAPEVGRKALTEAVDIQMTEKEGVTAGRGIDLDRVTRYD